LKIRFWLIQYYHVRIYEILFFRVAIAINRDNRWQVALYGDDWEGISRLEKNGIPRPIAEQLLDRAFPDWRQWETQ
jgi:hypothetical protein